MPNHRAHTRRSRFAWFAAAAAGIDAAVLILLVGNASVLSPAADPGVLSVRDECAQALGYEARTDADVAWLRQCVSALTPPEPTATPSPTPTPSPTVQPTTPAPTTTAPSPSPSPSPTSPGPTGWPTEAVTGATGPLTAWTGSCDLRTNNATYENRQFNCEVNVYATGVVIRNSLIRGAGRWGVYVRPGGSALLDHLTIQPTSGCNLDAAITGANYAATAIRALDWGEGFWVTNSGGATVTDSYARLCAPAGSGAHSDGIQAYLAAGPSTFRHNTIDQRGADSCCVTSPLFWSSSPGSQLTFVDNLLRGGGYSLRIHDGTGHVVTGNVIDRAWLFGPVLVDCARVATWSGNRVASVGADLSLSNVAAVSCAGVVSSGV
jgi:parallel beta helix pectate lyase-like protein